MGCAASRIDTSLEELYKIKALIGDGAEATVWLGQSFASRGKYALKLIPCNQQQQGSSRNIERRNVLNEAQSLAWLGAGHVNVVSLEEVVLTEHNVALVMEYVSGGTLAHLSCRHKMSEHEALYYFKQMVSAVDFCHQHHVAHRDLKLENILLDTTATPPRIKLADFGLSKHWEPASNRLCRMNTCAGTPGYISPEVAGTILHAPGSTYDGTKADVWALGVALVGMLLHHLPFAYSQLRHLSVKALLRNMHHQQLHTRWLDTPAIREHLAALSPPLRDLLTRIFLPDAAQRISLADIRRHPWLHQPLPRHYQAALDAMAAEQAARTRLAAAAVPGAADDDTVLSKPVRAQLQVLQAQLEAGGVPPGCVGRVTFAPWQQRQDAPQQHHTQAQAPAEWHYVAADERHLKDQASNPLAQRPPQHQQRGKKAPAQQKAGGQRQRSDKAERVPRPGANPLATAHL